MPTAAPQARQNRRGAPKPHPAPSPPPSRYDPRHPLANALRAIDAGPGNAGDLATARESLRQMKTERERLLSELDAKIKDGERALALAQGRATEATGARVRVLAAAPPEQALELARAKGALRAARDALSVAEHRLAIARRDLHDGRETLELLDDPVGFSRRRGGIHATPPHRVNPERVQQEVDALAAEGASIEERLPALRDALPAAENALRDAEEAAIEAVRALAAAKP